MPNIIEQQDLLKGLPDTRLAMLLQNPTGDIPPFLVAAEAQRRQAIRQQFAGSENKESVVDSLTKQLSKVPQNIRAPAQTPPMVPPTPEMQGVAALQTQQAVQQMAQPQGMRRGGVVQRYQAVGLVQPVGDRVQQIADQFGVTVDEASEMLRSNPNIGAPQIEGDLGKPFYVPETNQEPSASPIELNIPVLTTSPAEYAKRQKELRRESKYQEMDSYPGYSGNMTAFQNPDMRGLTAEEIAGENQRLLQRLNDQRSNAEQASDVSPEEGETPDEFRARYEALLKANEPSDWEKSQRWFSMAEQFLDPSKTTMQSVAGAGRAFADESAAMEAAKRQAQRDYEMGMLEYDINERDYRRGIEAEGVKTQREAYKFYAEQARSQVSAAQDQLKEIARQRSDYLANNISAQMGDPSKDPTIAELDRQAKDLMTVIDQYRGQYASALKGLGALTATDPSVEIFTGTGLKRVGG